MSTKRVQLDVAVFRVAIPLIGLVIGSSALGGNPVSFAQKPIEVRVEVDNFAAVYTGDGAGSLASLSSLGPMTSGPGGGIAIYPGVVTMMSPYIYIAAWSDDGAQQGLLAEVRTLKSIATSVLSGSANSWEVFATGMNLGTGSPAPNLAQLSAQIAIANAGGGCSGGWAPITVGGRAGFPVCNAPPWVVPGGSINAGARWMWYNDINDCAANGPHNEIAGCSINPPDVPFFSGHNHAEYLIFRTKLPCVNRWGDMIAWWPFNETAGPIAEDLAGNHKGYHQASANDPLPTCPGCFDGAALSFDGDDFVLVPHKADLNFLANVRTIEATIATVSTGLFQTILSKGTLFSSAGYEFGIDGGGLPTLFVIDDVLQLGSVGQSAIPTGDGWCSCIAVTFEPVDPSTVNTCFYVDGVLGGCNLMAGTALGVSNTDPMRIGIGDFGAFTGEIDQVTLYNRVLTAEELANNCVRKKCPCRPCRMFSPVYADVSPCGEGDGVIDVDDLLILLDGFAGNDSCPEE
ncbi:MAG: LamG domain-containing protein [Planctomycetota bacterium]